jgi:anion-transporting  ArsA/GET3 family ATPase
MALYFLSGKGGVGKTHLSTSLSMHLAKSGRKTLLVEFSKFAQFSEYFTTEIGFEPVKVEKDFYASSWTGLDCLHEYASKVLKSKHAANLFFKVPLMKKLSRVAPGLKEIAVLGKITSDYRENDFKTEFDDIVFDCPASGHFLSMMRVPESLSSTVGVGPMERECKSILESVSSNSDVYFALIQDGAHFAEIELKETFAELKKILNGKSISIIKNKSDSFPNTPSDSWLYSAGKLSKFWAEFTWK